VEMSSLSGLKPGPIVPMRVFAGSTGNLVRNAGKEDRRYQPAGSGICLSHLCTGDIGIERRWLYRLRRILFETWCRALSARRGFSSPWMRPLYCMGNRARRRPAELRSAILEHFVLHLFFLVSGLPAGCRQYQGGAAPGMRVKLSAESAEQHSPG
jgi:hypothetical protein